jgi:hypothetical protein
MKGPRGPFFMPRTPPHLSLLFTCPGWKGRTEGPGEGLQVYPDTALPLTLALPAGERWAVARALFRTMR